MLIDEVQPYFDATRVEHRIVVGEPAAVYEAVRRADFTRAWRESLAVRFLFAARTAGERTVCALRRRPMPALPEPEAMRLADMERHGEYVLLGENPPHEIAFGMIGRFWGGETVWEEIDADEFAKFNGPGYGKIACNFSLRSYGRERTLVSYECRTKTIDEHARRGFLRYWGPSRRSSGSCCERSCA